MGQGAIDYIGVKGGLDINGIIQDYYVYAGENINAGDFVEFVNGVASHTSGTSVDTSIAKTANYGYAISACKLTDNTVFVAHSSGINDDGDDLYGLVCTISGATITCGTDTMLYTDGGTGKPISAVALTSSKVFISMRCETDGFKLYGIVCNISGITITAGTATKIGGTTDSGGYANSTVVLATNKVFIAYCYSSGGSLAGIVCTISGTTISKGTCLEINSNSHTGKVISVALLESGKVFIAHSRTSSKGYLCGIVCTISGTTITKGTDIDLSSETKSGACISAVALSSTSVFIAHSYSSSYYLYGIIATVSGTTVTKGTDTAISTVIDSGTVISISLLSDGSIFVLHSYSSSFYLFGVKCIVSDATITVGTDTKLSTTAYTGYTVDSAVLTLGDREIIFVPHSYSSSYYLYAQLWGRDEENNNLTNEISVTEYETQVKKATSLPCNGVASTSGMGAHKVVEYKIAEGETINTGDKVEIEEQTFTDDIIPKAWTRIDAQNYISDNGVKLYGSLVPENDNDTWGLVAMCDGNLTTGYSARNSYMMFGRLTFTDKIKITKMKIKAYISTASLFKELLIQGGEPNKTFSTLHTVTTQDQISSNLTEIELTSPDYYTEYRCMLSATTSTQVTHTLYEWQVSEYCKTVVKKATSSYNGTALQSGTAGDTIQIAVPVSNEESTGHKDIVSIYKPPYSIYNLITNGDFSNGLDNWKRNSTTDIATYSVQYGIATITYSTASTGTNNITLYQLISCKKNHKYYVSTYCKAKGIAHVNFYTLYLTASTQNQWELVSGIVTTGENASASNFIVGLKAGDGNNATVGDNCQYKQVKLYDLTEMFGAGNEPTKEWCDENL